MKPIARLIAAGLPALLAASAFATDFRVVGVVFDRGAETARIADEIKGGEPVMYRFRVKQGQPLSVTLEARQQNADFILYGPGKWPGTVMHDSAATGSRQFDGRATREGPHAVLVSPSDGRAAGEPARFDLVITVRKTAP